MKIYSWNMLFRNKELDRAFEFISTSGFDVFCLQEVPQVFLDRLLTLPCHHAYTVDVDRVLPEGNMRNYLVILSRYPISNEHYFPFPDYWPTLPWYTRALVHLLRPIGFSKVKNRSSFSVKVATPVGLLHVYNLHLVLAHPTLRLREFEQAMAAQEPERPTIVCGDFNILERAHITPLNWLFGGRVSDALRCRRERTLIEERFVAHELTNPLRGSVTHPLSSSQLDHILVSHSLFIKNAVVISDRVGSDHHPICLEVV